MTVFDCDVAFYIKNPQTITIGPPSTKIERRTLLLYIKSPSGKYLGFGTYLINPTGNPYTAQSIDIINAIPKLYSVNNYCLVPIFLSDSQNNFYQYNYPTQPFNDCDISKITQILDRCINDKDTIFNTNTNEIYGYHKQLLYKDDMLMYKCVVDTIKEKTKSKNPFNLYYNTYEQLFNFITNYVDGNKNE